MRRAFILAVFGANILQTPFFLFALKSLIGGFLSQSYIYESISFFYVRRDVIFSLSFNLLDACNGLFILLLL
jgi:hypothetical protein